MNMAPAGIRPADVVRTITRHPRRLVVPVVMLTALALGYAVFRPATWEVYQALVVRDEAGDGLTRPGKFAHADEMKSQQETLVELIKSPAVLAKALQQVGPPADVETADNWPTDRDVEDLQDNVRAVAPGGAPFGTTEVFYLTVRDNDRPRAKQLALAICRQVQERFGQLRKAKAHSVVDELTKTVAMANLDLASATRALSTLEEQVGGDLAELRILNELPSGDSDLRRTTTELDKELRAFLAVQSENEEFLEHLTAAAANPDSLLASPTELLRSQPALGRLKNGLVDAQLRTGQLRGTMGDKHPLVLSAVAAEEAIRRQMHDEIGVALGGVQLDLRVNAARIQALREQQADLQARIANLASVRAEYANLVAATKNRSETLKVVEHELAEARASESASQSASLINLVDAPHVGTRPVGPRRIVIVLAGLVGGLLMGLAIVLVTVEAQPRTSLAVRHRAIPSPIATPGWRSTPPNMKQTLRSIATYRVFSP